MKFLRPLHQGPLPGVLGFRTFHVPEGSAVTEQLADALCQLSNARDVVPRGHGRRVVTMDAAKDAGRGLYHGIRYRGGRRVRGGGWMIIVLFCALGSCSPADKMLVIKGTVINTQLDAGGVDALVKIDDGVFQIDRVEIRNADTLILHENVVPDVGASKLFPARRKLVSNGEKVLSGYPEIRRDIQNRIDGLRSELARRYSEQEPWISYNLLQDGKIDGSKFFVVVLTDSDRTYGGYVYLPSRAPSDSRPCRL